MRTRLAGLALWALLSAACGGDEKYDCYVYDNPGGWGHYYSASSPGEAEDECEKDYFDCSCD
jgi:hypothetical protein